MARITIRKFAFTASCALALVAPATASAQRGADNSAADSIKYRYASTARLDALKVEAAKEIDAQAKQIQVMVDQVFSYGELGFQEFETSKYLTGILEKNGFTVERGVAGIPTAFVARWGAGKGTRLVAGEVDDNFWTLDQAIKALTESPAQPKQIQAITVASPPPSSAGSCAFG